MPKSTTSLTEAQLKRAREIHKQVLDENTTLRRIVEEAIAGKRGEERQKAWAKVVRIIFRRNALYRAAVRDRFNAAGIPTAPR